MVDLDAEQRLARLERHVQQLNHENRGLKKTMGQLARGEDPGEDVRLEREKDTPWNCQKCANQLGVYDEGSETLRIKARESFYWIVLGAGGHLTHPCRHCGELNEVFHVPAESVGADSAA